MTAGSEVGELKVARTNLFAIVLNAAYRSYMTHERMQALACCDIPDSERGIS